MKIIRKKDKIIVEICKIKYVNNYTMNPYRITNRLHFFADDFERIKDDYILDEISYNLRAAESSLAYYLDRLWSANTPQGIAIKRIVDDWIKYMDENQRVYAKYKIYVDTKMVFEYNDLQDINEYIEKLIKEDINSLVNELFKIDFEKLINKYIQSINKLQSLLGYKII